MGVSILTPTNRIISLLLVGVVFFSCSESNRKTIVHEKDYLVFKHMPRIVEVINDTLLLTIINSNTICAVTPQTGYVYDYLAHKKRAIIASLQNDSMSIWKYFHKNKLEYKIIDNNTDLFYKGYNIYVNEKGDVNYLIGVPCVVRDSFPIKKDSLVLALINYKVPVLVNNSSITVLESFPLSQLLPQAAFFEVNHTFYIAKFSIKDTVLEQVLIKINKDSTDTILKLGARKDFFNIRFQNVQDTLFFNFQNKILFLCKDKIVSKFFFPNVKEIISFKIYNSSIYIDAKDKSSNQYVFFIYDIRKKRVVYTHKRLSNTSYAAFSENKLYFFNYEDNYTLLNTIVIDK